MASTSSETPSLSLSSSSSSIPGSSYDVFLSFRGEDTCHSFTDHLYEAFRSKGIEAFRDSEKLQLGQEIASELIQAIENSHYAIVVFSEKYADSRWCLDELAEIVECKRNKGLEVVPVFYHVDPSDVQKQIGPFEKAFDEHQKNDKIDRGKIQKWKDAMREVGNLPGEHLRPHQRSEAECIKDVEVILNKLSNAFSPHTLGLVGIESRVEKLKSHLAIESNDVRMIGIWGTGGMGKTTLARVVYEMVSNKFEACCFIADVSEKSKKCGLCKLQTILLEKLLMPKNFKVQDVDDGVLMIKNRLRKKKILLILDDVTELDQLKKLAGENCWFGSGSRVIITTRDQHLLVSHVVNGIYEAEVLNHEEALQLFSLKALKMDHPPEDYRKLSQAFIEYSMGLPLALEVLGSSLFKKTIDEWISELDRLTEFSNRRILNVLQKSFDGLQATEKDIFLNIACFFNHKNGDSIIKFLDYLELDAESGLRVLIDKSLIKLHENQLWMHDLLQEMGRDIVCQECKDPGKRSRLWSLEDIDNVLKNNTGTKQIQCIVLEMHEPKKLFWNPEAFSRMRNLKLLKICGVQAMCGPKHLPTSLRILDWKGYPSKSLTFNSQSKCSVQLKFIDLSHSENLNRTPDFSDVPKLEVLNLVGCVNLVEIHPSIGQLSRLERLNLSRCNRLVEIHPSIGQLTGLTYLHLRHCESLTDLPSMSAEMQSLMVLDLFGCFKISLFPKFTGIMKSLSELNLGETAINRTPNFSSVPRLERLNLSCNRLVEIHPSIGQLTGLRYLHLRHCESLTDLPSMSEMQSLKVLDLFGCFKISSFPKFTGIMKSLSELNLGETAINRTPDFSGVLRLERLNLSCNRLVEIHPSIGQLTRLRYLHLRHCESLTNLPSMFAEMQSLMVLDLFGCFKISSFPKFTGIMKSLSELNLGETAIKKLSPSSIACLTALTLLDLTDCRNLKCLPSNMDNLRSLEMLLLSGCSKIKLIPRLPSTIRYINAQYCYSLEWSPALVKLSSLSRPLFRWRAHDESGSGIAFTILYRLLQGLLFRKTIYETSNKGKKDGSITELLIIVYGYKIPSWLTHQSVGNSISIKLPSNWCNSKWMGFAFCASISVSKWSGFGVRGRVIVNGGDLLGDMPQNHYAYELFTMWKHCEDSKSMHYVGRIWLLYLSRDDWFAIVGNDECSQIKLIFETSDSAIHVCECGVSLVYKQDVDKFSQANAQCLIESFDGDGDGDGDGDDEDKDDDEL